MCQDLFLDVLKSTATKREARSYISRFNRPKAIPQQAETTSILQRKKNFQKGCLGVNLGNLYLTPIAAEESPIFSQIAAPRPFLDANTEPLHVALVLIKQIQSIDNVTLLDFGHTLSQLSRLGLSCVVVVDHQTGVKTQGSNKGLAWRVSAFDQADRIVKAIDEHGGAGARYLDSIIGIAPNKPELGSSTITRGRVQITNRKVLLAPLRRGIIPVVAPVGYTLDTQTASLVHPSEVVVALTREFAGLFSTTTLEDDPLDVAEKVDSAQRQISLDRIIVLDPYGGIPSLDRSKRSHVFINLEQEYEGIKEELTELGNTQHIAPRSVPSTDSGLSSAISSDFPLDNINQDILVRASKAQDSIGSIKSPNEDPSIDTHLSNLWLIRDSLILLPPSSSGLLTSPEEAANSHRRASPSATPGVGTRSQRNPLIHNLLTDKPTFSSSLPSTRFSKTGPRLSLPGIQPSPTTFIKRGMPVTIIPDPRTDPWVPPAPSSVPLQLSDPRIDLPRLIHLIEDSFGRRLDVSHYLSRISSNLAGIIIAGSYEGGALLTWESPPNATSPNRLVPYLDKFAVLKRSQGAGGVADIVFSAMVRDCFPQGVVWRSRKDNPVNKWYFERARGTWQLPVKEPGGQGWTMFWTTEGVREERFKDYEAVCERVVPSWGDGKRVLD